MNWHKAWTVAWKGSDMGRNRKTITDYILEQEDTDQQQQQQQDEYQQWEEEYEYPEDIQ
jgi:hypothetical protein